MIKVLFVCWGNICRSPMCEFVMKDLVEKAGLTEHFLIESAATSSEEIWNGVGNPVYPPMKRTLEAHGIRCSGHAAKQLTRRDYDSFDYLIGTDQENIYYMHHICGGDPEEKFSLLMDYTDRPGTEISDPWYTRDFERTYRDVIKGCTGLLDYLRNSGKLQR